jgi:hypothetical protein
MLVKENRYNNQILQIMSTPESIKNAVILEIEESILKGPETQKVCLCI